MSDSGTRIGSRRERKGKADRMVSRYWMDGDWLTTERPNCLWRTHADAVHRDLLQRWFPAVGGGTGVHALKTDLYDEAMGDGQAEWLAKRSELVIGIDLTAAVVAAATQGSRGLRAVVADVQHLPFRDGSFDLVVSLSTLDHFATPEAIPDALTGLARVLRPGGLLILTLDNPANPIIALRQALPFPLLHRLGVVPYFCGPSLHPRQLPTAIRSAGFEVEELSTILHCPRALIVPIARWVNAVAPAFIARAFLRGLRAFEYLGRLPSRYVTGHFVAARCIRRT